MFNRYVHIMDSALYGRVLITADTLVATAIAIYPAG